jgi:hypothetical protein
VTLPDRQDPVCGTCADVFQGSLAVALSRGWGYWNGTTSGGTEAEYIICRKCRTEGHKRKLRAAQEYEDTPLF